MSSRALFGFVLALAGCGATDPCALDVPVRSIDEAVALTNELPEPSISCFVTALARPLGVELTSNVFSLQPALSRRSPRIFLSEGPLVMSIVPAGDARNLLEFGELLDDGRSAKAEIAFPLEGLVTRANAFETVLDHPGARGTSCGVCHADEVEIAPGEFASVPLRPDPTKVVALEVLADEHAFCDPTTDEAAADRCAMLDAVFDHGPVEHHPLPDDYPF